MNKKIEFSQKEERDKKAKERERENEIGFDSFILKMFINFLLKITSKNERGREKSVCS